DGGGAGLGRQARARYRGAPDPGDRGAQGHRCPGPAVQAGRGGGAHPAGGAGASGRAGRRGAPVAGGGRRARPSGPRLQFLTHRGAPSALVRAAAWFRPEAVGAPDTASPGVWTTSLVHPPGVFCVLLVGVQEAETGGGAWAPRSASVNGPFTVMGGRGMLHFTTTDPAGPWSEARCSPTRGETSRPPGSPRSRLGRRRHGLP